MSPRLSSLTGLKTGRRPLAHFSCVADTELHTHGYECDGGAVPCAASFVPVGPSAGVGHWMMIGDDEEFGPLPGDSQSLGDLHEVWLRRRQAESSIG